MNVCPECKKPTDRKFCSNKCSNVFNGKLRAKDNLGQQLTCVTCGETKPKGQFSYNVRGDIQSGKKDQCKRCGRGAIVQARRSRDWKHKAAQVLLRNSFRRAKVHGLEHAITIADIIIPEICPVLGIPLHREDKSTWMNAPSIDRIKNTEGYTKGNIIIVSRRANILKRDATVDELILIAKFYSQYKE